jgi:hypothetical protein
VLVAEGLSAGLWAGLSGPVARAQAQAVPGRGRTIRPRSPARRSPEEPPKASPHIGEHLGEHPAESVRRRSKHSWRNPLARRARRPGTGSNGPLLGLSRRRRRQARLMSPTAPWRRAIKHVTPCGKSGANGPKLGPTAHYGRSQIRNVTSRACHESARLPQQVQSCRQRRLCAIASPAAGLRASCGPPRRASADRPAASSAAPRTLSGRWADRHRPCRNQ